ncbi:SemiSWEET family sugar transporter [Flaviflagellibacter deserti]|jgi:MtN3 and saliva related transmembrane protein|uniref:SemiSWEET family sugar transporter n=1 Tax=Flaviflagellibacter deserti TaxID=2267266 RepID=A0ABV9YXB3_9HYPH
MDGSLTSIVGLVAAFVTTSAAVPQVLKAWRTRSTGDLSWRMLVIQACGLSAWVLYGVLKADSIIIGANAVGTSLYLGLIAMKARWR